MQFTEPFEVHVVAAAHVAPAPGPKRSSLPSRLPVPSWSIGSPAKAGFGARLSVVMAQAVKELWPEVKVTIGPAIDNGFYYDFDKKEPFSDDDLAKITKKMRQIIERKPVFTSNAISRDEAIKMFSDMGETYKVELIQGIPAGEKVLQLSPPDPTTVHFELATLLADSDIEAARLHTLQALEEAPRFREAQKLLLKFPKSETTTTNNGVLDPYHNSSKPPILPIPKSDK